MRYRLLTALAPLALAAAVAACNGDIQGPDMKWADPTKITYYPGLHVDLGRMSRTATGVFWWDSIQGGGTEGAVSGDRVNVRYKLWFPDGTLVDSAQALNLRMLGDSIIIGMLEGLTGAVQGTTRQLVIPPEAAYGAGTDLSGRIPPYTTLIFLVTVNSITHVGAGGDLVPVTSPPGEVPALTRALAGALARSARASP